MYYITERKSNSPRDDDPKAQAMMKHTGVYDLRNVMGVVIVSGCDLRSLRSKQARLNTDLVCNAGGIC